MTAVVDSGAEANALPENMMHVDSPEAQFSFQKSREDLPGRRRRSIPARGERSVTGRTEEEQSRRIVNRLGSLPSEASSLERGQDQKARKSSLLGRGQGLRQQQQDGADHKPPSRAQRVDA